MMTMNKLNNVVVIRTCSRPRRLRLWVLSLALLIAACGLPPSYTPLSTAPAATPVSTEPGPAPTSTEPEAVGTVLVATAQIGTVLPSFSTRPPPGYTPPPTKVPPTLTPIPSLPGGLGPSELKYRLLAQFPDFFFCDPDYYPVARADEKDLALQRFPEVQANVEEFNTILAHNNLRGQTTFDDDQKLLIYRDHKKLAAIAFDVTPYGYKFQLQVAKSEGAGELVVGTIDSRGTITVEQRSSSFATCPICLAANTLIDTPDGRVKVTDIRVGTLVWTLDSLGTRIAAPVLLISKTGVPLTHHVLHLRLADGRAVSASPGHPTLDGRALRDLHTGDSLDGSTVSLVESIPYTGLATYDLLPAGATGVYWADGVLLGSTLTDR